MARQNAPQGKVVTRAVPALTWRCANCGRLDGPVDTGTYTDGCCDDCIYQLYGPDRGGRIIAAIIRDGDVPHHFPH